MFLSYMFLAGNFAVKRREQVMILFGHTMIVKACSSFLLGLRPSLLDYITYRKKVSRHDVDLASLISLV